MHTVWFMQREHSNEFTTRYLVCGPAIVSPMDPQQFTLVIVAMDATAPIIVVYMATEMNVVACCRRDDLPLHLPNSHK